VRPAAYAKLIHQRAALHDSLIHFPAAARSFVRGTDPYRILAYGLNLFGALKTRGAETARAAAAIQAEMDRMLAERKASQPVWLRNAGCVFKNQEGTSAGLLIDRSGCKGMSVGNVEVSDVHANFMVTKGGIMAADVLQLIERVRLSVRDREGVDLETEVRIVGEFGIENV